MLALFSDYNHYIILFSLFIAIFFTGGAGVNINLTELLRLNTCILPPKLYCFFHFLA